MAAFSDFHRFVRPFVAATVPAIDAALRDAAIEFCEKTRVVTDELDGLPIYANVPEVDLVWPDTTDLTIAQSLEVASTVRPIPPKTSVQLDALYPDGWLGLTTADVSNVVGWFAPTRATVRLVPYLSVTLSNALKVRVALKPSRTATELPAELFEHYPEAIAAGALARLHKAPGGDPSRVGAYLAEFNSAIVGAADNYAHGFGKVILRTGRDEFV